MKKFGFTLAEILITLSIIGVVAAITLPTLMTDTMGAQIGPKLAKAVSAFEQANEALLHNNSVDSITDSGLFPDGGYTEELSNHLKITPNAYDGSWSLSKDGIGYQVFKEITTGGTPDIDSTLPAHKQRIGNLWIDINGASKPNTWGEDRFAFSLWNDGSLRPKGGTNWDGKDTSKSGASQHWKFGCPADELPSDYSLCAGHIFENNLKVLYK